MWQGISNAPFDRDLELAVIAADGIRRPWRMERACYAGPIEQSGSVPQRGGQMLRISQKRLASTQRLLSAGRCALPLYGGLRIEDGGDQGKLISKQNQFQRHPQVLTGINAEALRNLHKGDSFAFRLGSLSGPTTLLKVNRQKAVNCGSFRGTWSCRAGHAVT
jgi:hypothetical protein